MLNTQATRKLVDQLVCKIAVVVTVLLRDVGVVAITLKIYHISKQFIMKVKNSIKARCYIKELKKKRLMSPSLKKHLFLSASHIMKQPITQVHILPVVKIIINVPVNNWQRSY